MSDDPTGYKTFDAERARIIQDLSDLKDKSPKGSIDEPIRRFLTLINAHQDVVTTSTCSGRLVSYLPGISPSPINPQDTSQGPQSASQTRPSVNGKGGGNWLFVSHSTLEADQIRNPVKTLFGDHVVSLEPFPEPNRWPHDGSSAVVHLVYQPPVLHLLVRSVAAAIPLLKASIGSGFRNSGLTIGQRGRVILAIRSSTGGMDVPIALQRASQNTSNRQELAKDTLQLLVGVEYLHHLLIEGNKLMEQNEAKLQRLYDGLSQAFRELTSIDSARWESAEDRKRRMRAEGLATRLASASQNPQDPSPALSDHDDIPDLLLFN